MLGYLVPKTSKTDDYWSSNINMLKNKCLLLNPQNLVNVNEEYGLYILFDIWIAGIHFHQSRSEIIK